METLDLNKEVNDIVTEPLPPRITNWRLITIVSLSTAVLVLLVAWLSGALLIRKPRLGPDQTNPTNARGQKIKGNYRTMVYHLPGCMSYNSISPDNVEWFETKEDAEKAGYRLARNCGE